MTTAIDRIELDAAMSAVGVKVLPERCCGRCRHWTRLQPDDLTAGEGHCGLTKNPGHWPFGYWPATLQRDGCRKFRA